MIGGGGGRRTRLERVIIRGKQDCHNVTAPNESSQLREVGRYHQDPDKFRQLVDEMYEKYTTATLPVEYDYFIQDNLLRLLIRLARYKFVARLLQKTDRVLEVGCGSGLGSIFLSQHCASVVGLDVKDYEIEEARTTSRRDNVEFVCQDLFEYRPSEAFDVAVSLDVIEHMEPADGLKLLRGMTRLLRKPTGMLVIGSPSIYSYPYQGALSQASHVHCYDQAELAELIGQCCGRTLSFSMNDEMVHTGHPKMAWYYFILGLVATE